jgi:hypothetical protein
LERRGYLKYEPSFSPRRPSHVHLYKFDKGGHKGARKGGDQAARKGDRKAAVKVVIPELNNTNDINLTNPINDLNDASTLKKSFDQSGKRNKKTSDIPGSLHDPLPDIKKKGAGRPGSVEAVKAWFAEQQSTATAAEKFYYYYEGIGWKIGGRTAMKSWKAFARYWIKNEKTATYETDKHKPGTKLKPGTLHVAPGKNYDEPL